MQLYIERMACGGCAKAVAKAIESLDPSATITADTTKRIVTVETSLKRDEIEKALVAAGYPARAP